MSRIEQLIEELCPNGVEFKPLGEIAEYSTHKVASSEINDEQFIGVENLKSNFSGFVAGTKPEKETTLNSFREGDILLGNIRPYLKKMIKADFSGGASPDVLVISILKQFRELIDSKYLYWVLSSSDFVAYNSSNSRGGKMPRGNKKMILRYQIPVPPLKVQEEIVRILDSFTLLEAELEAELEARRKQYAFYRDSLLNFEQMGGRTKFTTLGQIFSMKAGKHLPASEIYAKPESGYPCFGGNGIRGYSENYSHDGDYLIIGRQGALCGNVQRYLGKFYATEHAVVVDMFGTDSSWAYHFLTQMNLRQYASKSAQPGLNVSKLKGLSIPEIPLEYQQKVGAILDKFDALVNDISSGLPAEIAARRKQYEYYRDQLLTFKELEPASSR